MADPAQIDDLIVIHANEETQDMGRPTWVEHRAIYRLSEVAAWTKNQDSWDFIRTPSTEVGTKYGDLPVFKLILK